MRTSIILGAVSLVLVLPVQARVDLDMQPGLWENTTTVGGSMI